MQAGGIFAMIYVCSFSYGDSLMEINAELRSKETWLVSEDGLWDISFGLCCWDGG